MASLPNQKFGYASTLWFTIIVAAQFISADVSRNIVYLNSKFVCDTSEMECIVFLYSYLI